MLNLEYIDDDETLYRAVPNQPDFWKPEFNKPSSALFKDKNGVSVDRDGGRSPEGIVNVFEKSKPGYGLVYITAGKCRELETHPLPKPIEGNTFHAEIHQSKTKILLSRGKANALSNAVLILTLPESYR